MKEEKKIAELSFNDVDKFKKLKAEKTVLLEQVEGLQEALVENQQEFNDWWDEMRNKYDAEGENTLKIDTNKGILLEIIEGGGKDA